MFAISLSLGFCNEVSTVSSFDYDVNDLSLEKMLDKIDVKALKDDRNKTLTQQEQKQIQNALNKMKKDLK